MLIRELHPHRELDRYDILPSWGNYERVIEKPRIQPLPDYSALSEQVQEAAIVEKLRRLRRRNGQKTGRAL